MRKEKILITVILVLVLLNTTTLVLMWVNRPPVPLHRQNGTPDKMIFEQLSFDKKQQDQFIIIRDEHRSHFKRLNEEMEKIQKEYFQLLTKENFNDSLVMQYESKLAEIYKEKMEVTFDHFNKLKRICRKDQLEKYNQFITELGKVIAGPKRGKHH